MLFRSLFIITEADVWKINSDQVNDFSFFQDKKAIVRSGNSINTNSTFSRSGFFLKKDGFKMVFQNATPIFLSRGTILNYKQGDFVLEKKIFATLVNYTQQTEDIVQGLPKIEELVEARRPKVKAQLSRRPGIILNSVFSSQVLETILSSSVIRCISTQSLLKEEDSLKAKSKAKIKKKQEKQKVAIGHSIYLKDSLVVFDNHVYKARQVPTTFEPTLFVKEAKVKDLKKLSDEFVFKNLEIEEDDSEIGGTLLIDSKLKFSL